MPISVVQVSTAGFGNGTAVSTSFPSPVTAGNGIIVLIGAGANNLTSVTDNKGNTYALARSNNFFGTNTSTIEHCLSTATGGSSFTVTANFSSATAVDQIIALEVLGTLTLDQVNGGSGNLQNPQPGAITTTFANTIVVVQLEKNGSVITVPTGYTSDNVVGNAGAAHNIYTSTQSGLNPQWTTNTSTAFAATIAAYTSSAIIVPFPGQYLETLVGPPMRGAPWAKVSERFMALLLTPPAPSSPGELNAIREILAGPPMRGAPWVKIAAAEWGKGQTPPPPTPPPAIPGGREMIPGPPMKGAPWYAMRQNPDLSGLYMAPPPPPVSLAVGATEITIGPPIAGPWHARAVGVLETGVPPPPKPGPVNPIAPGKGTNKPFVQRLPKDRVRRAAAITERLHSMMNSLIGKGQLVQTGIEKWDIRSGAIVETRDPTPADDLTLGCPVGVHWVNSTTRAVFICVFNGKGAADWKLL